jgi:hypothetical protein
MENAGNVVQQLAIHHDLPLGVDNRDFRPGRGAVGADLEINVRAIKQFPVG